VNFYEIVKGTAQIRPELAIVRKSGPSRIASFQFSGEGGASFEGELLAVEGRINSLQFNLPTEHILDTVPANILITLDPTLLSLATDK